MTLGEILSKYRKEKGYTQETVGPMIGLTPRAYQDFEANKRVPKFDTMILLHKVLGFSWNEVLDEGNFVTSNIAEKIPDTFEAKASASILLKIEALTKLVVGVIDIVPNKGGREVADIVNEIMKKDYHDSQDVIDEYVAKTAINLVQKGRKSN